MKRLLLSLALLLVAAGLSGCGYNTIQQYDEAVIAAWGDVEAAYQRRADLIPNLVEVVKGYAAHEKETLTAVTEARAQVGKVQIGKDVINNPQAMASFQEAQGGLSSALSRLMVVVERYPDLKANQNFMMLQEELSGTESKIAYARQFYNDTVLKYDNMREKFPSNIVAAMFNFAAREYFEVGEAEREPVKVKF